MSRLLCKLGLHKFDSSERSWPVPNPGHIIYFHCGRCQKTIGHDHGKTGYVQKVYGDS
jgi:hypothetical protein